MGSRVGGGFKKSIHVLRLRDHYVIMFGQGYRKEGQFFLLERFGLVERLGFLSGFIRCTSSGVFFML